MNIISKLTLRHLKENKKRTIVTIIGIAVSTALITAILVGAFSFFRFFGDISVTTSGNVHAVFNDLTDEQIQGLKADERVLYAGVSDTNSDVSGVMLENDKELRYRTGNIAYGDTDYFKEMIVSDYEGRLPENANEIAVEAEFLKDNGLSLQVGDTLDFVIGNRYSIDENGEKIYWAGGWRSGESFEEVTRVSCTITAILHNNRPTGGYDIVRGLENGGVTAKNAIRICLKDLDHKAISQIKQIAKDYGVSDYSWNTEIMISVFSIEGGGESYKALFAMIGIALAIVILTSVVLIYNSFGMSLTEMIRYLGMLASVGATGKQKRFSIYYEAFILGIIGIVIGILIGILGCSLTLNILGHRILSSNMIVGTEGLNQAIPTQISLPVILIIVVITSLTIYVSAMVPAIKASKIMPVDALRQTNAIRVKAKRLRINPLVKVIFGYEGELAYKNIKRNGLKGTVITISIAVSVIMFLAISYFCDGLNRANYYDLNLPYQVLVSCSYDECEKLKAEIGEMKDVDRVFEGDFIAVPFKASEDVKQPANGDILNPQYLTSAYSNLYDNTDSFFIVVIDDEHFKNLLIENGLSEDKYLGEELRGVLLNNYFHEKNGDEIFNDGIIGQKLFYDDPVDNPPAVEIGDFVKYDEKDEIFRLLPKATVAVYVPASVYYEKAIINIPQDKLTCSICVVTSKHDSVYKNVSDMLEEGGYHNYSCSDMAESLAIMQTIVLIMRTGMYGFTILLTLIAIANIVNTISTGVILRRKEFAMYKSVGMDGIGFKKMIFLETLIYGIRALIIGLPIALILSFIMFNAMKKDLYTFDVNPVMYLTVIVGVFAVVGLSMLLGMRKIKNDNIIEALKEDMV
ncbi:MAG: FtsX-like permease family protein [Eubacterium sp.]|nr:FtsX-like permease family protein [Eubacterium sp.]